MWKIIFDIRTQEFVAVDFMDTIRTTNGGNVYPSAVEMGEGKLTLFGDSKEELLEMAEQLVDTIRQNIFDELDEGE